MTFLAAKKFRPFKPAALAMGISGMKEIMESSVVQNVCIETYTRPKYHHNTPPAPRAADNLSDRQTRQEGQRGTTISNIVQQPMGSTGSPGQEFILQIFNRAVRYRAKRLAQAPATHPNRLLKKAMSCIHMHNHRWNLRAVYSIFFLKYQIVRK